MSSLRLIPNAPSVSESDKWCLTIGNFDGVHSGHRHLLRQTVVAAKKDSLRPGVLIFDPSPSEVLQKIKGLKMLCSFNEKIRRLKENGMDGIFVQTFDCSLAKLSAEEFMRKNILKKICVQKLVLGYDFRFGKNRKGDVKFLQLMPEFQNTKIQTAEPLQINGEIISSSLIRNQLSSGQFLKAAEALGRNWSFHGIVKRGDRRGKKLGFPTANLEGSSQCPLKFGVYAVQILWEDREYEGIMNFGKRPTFQKDDLRFEIHIFDFDKDIYGENIEVFPVYFVRDEMKFDSPGSLQAQIKEDVKNTYRHFAKQVFV